MRSRTASTESRRWRTAAVPASSSTDLLTGLWSQDPISDQGDNQHFGDNLVSCSHGSQTSAGVALASAIGLHWEFFSNVAWEQMVIYYSQKLPALERLLVKT